MTADPILLQEKYGDVVEGFAATTGISLDQALEFFYGSHTHELMSRGVSDMHCRSVTYLVEELLDEVAGNGSDGLIKSV